MLDQRGVPARERLKISPSCPLILPYHIALDQARECAAARRHRHHRAAVSGPRTRTRSPGAGLRLGDLLDPGAFADKLREVMEYHNFAFEHYFKAEPSDYQACSTRSWPRRERSCRWWRTSRACCTRCGRDGKHCCSRVPRAPCSTSITAPIPSSPRPPPRRRRSQRQRGRPEEPRLCARHRQGLHHPGRRRALSRPSCSMRTGITWARRGASSAPPQGASARCGWLDMVALKRSFDVNSVTGICHHQARCARRHGEDSRLHRLRAGRRAAERTSDHRGCPGAMPAELPRSARLGRNRPSGATSFDALPENARSYLAKIEELSGLPIDVISTGPDRAHTIVKRQPFGA